MAEEGETWTLTYAELAQMAGLELASARRLVFRKKWPRTRGNDGLARVRVPVDALARPSGSHSGTPPNDTSGSAPLVIVPPAVADTVAAMMPAEAAELRERLAAAEAELRRELTRRAETAEAELRAERDARRAAEAAAADAHRRAEGAERDALEGWRMALRLARHLASFGRGGGGG